MWCDSDKPTMLTIHSITTQLQSQTLAESNSAKTDSSATSSLINSSQVRFNVLYMATSQLFLSVPTIFMVATGQV